MNAVIYARTSCTSPNARSIDNQVAVCREYCEREGWPVVGVFTDQTTGSGAQHGCHARPGLVAMLLTVESGGIERVVVETTDRIARHYSDASAILERVTLAGAGLVIAAGSDAPDLDVNILALFDVAFRRDRIERMKRGRRSVSASPPDPSVI